MTELRKRVLFVDDASMLLEALKRAMRSERARFDMEFALGPEAALELMHQRHFDVVVSDLEMPGMLGTELLDVLKRESPDTARVIMSGQLDPAVFVRAAAVMHRYLPKPFDLRELRATLVQLCEHQGQLADDGLRRLVGAAELPPAPDVYVEFTEAAGDATSSLRDLAGIITRDPAISAKVLQLANAAWFRGNERAVSIEAAVARLGVEVTRSLCLTAYLFDLNREDAALPLPLRTVSLQRAAVATSRLARSLASKADAEAAFVAGLLRQIAVLVLGPQHAEALMAARSAAPLGSETRADVERRLLGASVAQVSAYLLGLWGLPSAVVEAVLGHDRAPVKVPLDAAAAVWASACLIDEQLGAYPSLDYEALANLGLLGELPRWAEAGLALVGGL